MLKQLPWSGWPSGDCEVVMEVFVSHKELERRYGLEVEHFTEDGLGPGHATYFNDEILGPVMIECFDSAPSKAATVYVDSAIDLRVAIPRILKELDIDRSNANIRSDYLTA